VVGTGNVYTYDLIDAPDFVTVEQIEPLFSLFRGVVWVTGPYQESNDLKMARNLRTAEAAITAYVETGGRLFLAGQTIIGHRGGISLEFAQEMLGIPEYYQIRIEPEGTTVTDLDLNRETPVLFESGGQPGSLYSISSATRVDYFLAPTSPGVGVYWVAPGALREMIGRDTVPVQDADPAYLGVVAHHGDGTICLITTSYARLFPRQYGYEGDWGATIHEAVRLFREVLSP
jgi:hypothetical protein